ncbi:MAG: Cys-tRNA(Pro) deacylase [Actinobacteria bacterium]|nr:Cys-tRNA(Pro) deacylase [Ilumatobacteraceae bacterium]MDA0299816.1 Cys-tRNA(Pro) deacylase [Actinomycetota bacterium]MDA2961362.1 Cys-tRNA(Pro) deacylase [Actinomycetota bacterium]MDA2993873.1 Cys-tRNA(Pro) deacylase [Actinomycetota bacterium]
MTPAVQLLAERKISFRLCEYDHDPANSNFGLEAANELGLDPDQVFKTLIVVAGGDEMCAIVPVSGQLSLKAFANAVGVKRVVMCPPERAQRATGYLVGGISPIAQRRSLVTVIDETAQLYDEVFVSGGRRGLDVAVGPDDLMVVTGGMFADIATR